MTDYNNEPDDKQHQPGDKKCEPAYPDPPTYKPPEKCKVWCECPPGSGSTDNCLEDLIDAQTKPITDGDRAKAFKTELEQFLTKARAAKDEYTVDKYKKLVKQWEELDKDIVELLRKLVCALPCWCCVVECHVCPLLYQMRDAELQVNGDGKWCSEVHDLQDLLYWQTRDKDAKQRFFNRLKDLLAAWEKPAQTIEKILADNVKAVGEANKLLGTEPSKVLVDVFLRIIPLHLAIAPTGSKSNINKKYTELCCCDDRKPLECCGIDIGERSFRQRLIGPQPYLVDPNKYIDLICCLISHAYQPAKERLSAAEAAATSTENTIKRLRAVVENGLKTFDKTAKAAIPGAIDCDQYKPKDNSKCKEPDKAPDPDNKCKDSSSSKY